MITEVFHTIKPRSVDLYANASTLSLYARNTGSWYPLLCEFARQRVTHSIWTAFVETAILPRYRREFHEPRFACNIPAAAELLRDYYIKHVNE